MAVIVQKEMQSYRNGFIGVWLPRNMEGTLEVSYNGKTASHAIATSDDSQKKMPDNIMGYRAYKTPTR